MKRRLSEYKHVVWDWNGTLLDDLWLCLESLNALLALENRAPIDRERYRAIFEFPVIRVYAAMGFPTDDLSFKAGSMAFMAGYEVRRMECGLHAGARETLSALREAGVGQSVLSAYRHDLLETIVAEHRLGDYLRASPATATTTRPENPSARSATGNRSGSRRTR